MTLANGMVLVDQTAVPLALADIMQTFRVGSQSVQWVLSASLLSLAGLLVLGGKMGDLFGRRRVFVIGTIVFAGASVWAGLAPDFWVLVAGGGVALGAGGRDEPHFGSGGSAGFGAAVGGPGRFRRRPRADPER